MRKILFITTSNLTTNPRLFKELQIAVPHYKSEVLCFSLGNWSDAIDNQLLKSLANTKVHYLPASKKSFFTWLFVSVLHKFLSSLWPVFSKSIYISAVVSNKRSLQLWARLLFHAKDYADTDLIVAHNFGTLYPAYRLSKKLGIPFTFDVEDYHPGERIEEDAAKEKARRKYLMQKLLPKAAIVTAASPLIGRAVERLTGKKTLYINNSFFRSEFVKPNENNSNKLKLVWFSQNINFGRGLELCIKAMDSLKVPFALTLIGNLNEQFAQEWLKNRDYINVLPPMEQVALHHELANYDAGLALELRSADYNREIALTNKVFAYMQAGLFVIATDTMAQSQLISDYPIHGILTQQKEESIRESITFVHQNLNSIRSSKEKRFQEMKHLSFENEGLKLLNLWADIVRS